MARSKQLVECVPNFSEGRNLEIIRLITNEIEAVEGVKLLDVDPGEATNRTVVTFVGEPQAVCEAAFRAVCRAGELIDMRQHHGAHPRMGATDVLPLVPVSGITLEECAELARKLAERTFRATATRLRLSNPNGLTWPYAGLANTRRCLKKWLATNVSLTLGLVRLTKVWREPDVRLWGRATS